jgi:hypothetical protein
MDAMPQVARTTNDVIVNSLYLLGELGVGETPDAFMLSTGLELINELLDKFSSDSIYIPYLTTLSSQFVVGQDTYSISDIIAGTNITADRVVDLSLANYTVPGVGVNQNANAVSFTYTANLGTNLLTLSGSTNAFPSGTPVVLSTAGTIPSPLVPGVTYYAIYISPTTIQLALSNSNALSNIPIVLMSDGVPINTLTTYQGMTNGVTTSLVYPLRIINKATYWNVVRQTNLLSRPGFIFLNKQPNESLITVYPVPDQPYPYQIQVKCMINDLGNQDSLGELPPNYYGFMKYALARKFLAYYPSGNWPQQNEDEYQDYYMTLKNTNETDLTIRPSVTLTAPEPFYWPNILSY